MSDSIKIYRGIDTLDGSDSLFIVNHEGYCRVSTYAGKYDPWLHHEYRSLSRGRFESKFKERCKNPTLISEVFSDDVVAESPPTVKEKKANWPTRLLFCSILCVVLISLLSAMRMFNDATLVFSVGMSVLVYVGMRLCKVGE